MMSLNQIKEEIKEEVLSEDDSKKTGRLKEEVISYFKRVEQVLLEDSFEDEDHKEAFVKNVFNEVEKDGMQLGRHPITSRVMEQLIPLFTASQYKSLILIMEKDIEMLCCDRFASHVVELFCKEITKYVSQEDVLESYISLCKNIKKQIDVFLRDTYGSHVLSTLLQTLSGVQVPEVITKSRISRESKKVKKKGKKKPQHSLNFQNTLDLKNSVVVTKVPESFLKMYRKYFKTVIDDDNFGELLCHRTASPVLQVLVITLHKISSEKFASVTELIVKKARIETKPPNHHVSDDPEEESEEEDEETFHKLPVVLTDQVGSHLFEVLLQTADDESFDNLSTRCMLKMLVSLSIHPIANFLVQTLLRCLNKKKKAKPFVKKLTKYTEDVLAAGHMGCIVRVAETIARLKMKKEEETFIKALVTSLHIPDDKEKIEESFCKLVLSVMTHDMFFKTGTDVASLSATIDDTPDAAVSAVSSDSVILKNDHINYHGACLLKSCLSFEKCDYMVKSFMALSRDELTTVACHPSGNHAFESFLANTNIKRKLKNTLSDKLYGKFAVLASDKFGSRVIDALWKVVGENSKGLIKNELTQNKARLESDLYGRIVLCNCEINQQARKMREIKERQEKKRKMFEDILPVESSTKNKKGKPTENTSTVEREEKQAPQPPLAKKAKGKNQNDRVAKYREQLKALGISFDEEN